MKTKFKAGIILIALLVCSLSLHADSTRDRDGNWWRTLTIEQREIFITGFYDGMQLGHNFSYWNFISKKSKETCIADTTNSFKTFMDKYTQNVTNIQLADGMNTFYSDYRNRSILIQDAVWLVLNSIAGTPQERLDKMVESFRKAAASSER